MNQHTPRPGWWQVYARCLLLVALFFLEARLAISTIAHQAVQIAILAFIFGLIFRWIHGNDRGLAREKPPLFRLPQGGLSHTLSDTFPLDEAEDLPSAIQETGRHR